MNEWLCYIREEVYTLQTHLFLVRETAHDGLEYATIGDNGAIILTEGKRFEPIKPFLTLTDMMAKELFKGLADCLDKRGIKTESTSKVEGKLEATLHHLEDLRKLLKLK